MKIETTEMLIVGNVAKALGVKRLWARKLLERGTIAGCRIDGVWYGFRKSVEAYAADRPPVGRPKGS